jgi:hypothetical protein
VKRSGILGSAGAGPTRSPAETRGTSRFVRRPEGAASSKPSPLFLRAIWKPRRWRPKRNMNDRLAEQASTGLYPKKYGNLSGQASYGKPRHRGGASLRSDADGERSHFPSVIQSFDHSVLQSLLPPVRAPLRPPYPRSLRAGAGASAGRSRPAGWLTLYLTGAARRKPTLLTRTPGPPPPRQAQRQNLGT